MPYRICETNSFCGGGKPGVSDTFDAASGYLVIFHLAWADAAGVNIETGLNQLGFISSYCPIGDDEHGTYWAKPEYYGMLAFAQASRGQRLAVEFEVNDVNLTAYGVLGEQKQLWVTLVNKDVSLDTDVSITSKVHFSKADLLRLTALSMESKDEITLGGSAVAADGGWKPKLVEQARITRGECLLRVPAASAAIVRLEA